MTEPIKIDTETAFRVLDECVAERGEDYVYRKPIGRPCLYWHGKVKDGTPGCIIGLALHKLGVHESILDEWGGAVFGAIVFTLRERGVADISPSAYHIFRIVQQEQDDGEPWGKAVAHARERYEAGEFN